MCAYTSHYTGLSYRTFHQGAFHIHNRVTSLSPYKGHSLVIVAQKMWLTTTAMCGDHVINQLPVLRNFVVEPFCT